MKIYGVKSVSASPKLAKKSESELEAINRGRELEEENLKLLKSIVKIKDTYNTLEENNNRLKDKLDILMNNEKTLINSNSKFEKKLHPR